MLTNQMVDNIMPNVSGNAWKVFCAVVRLTDKKGWADISFKHFQKQTGIRSKTTLANAIKYCLDHGLIFRSWTGESEDALYSYALNPGVLPPTDAKVYLIRNEDNGLVKIGWSGNPELRFKRLHTLTGANLTFLWSLQGGKTVERHLHNNFAAKRKQGEWFDLDETDIAYINELMGGSR